MVGAALACRLAQDNPGLRVALVEARRFQPAYDEKHFDSRVVALTSASQGLLRDIGVWQDICDQRYCPYQRMVVWDGTGTGRIEFNSQEIAEPALGVIVENSIIVEALLKKIEQHAIEVLCPETVSTILLPDNHGSARLLFDSGKSIHASLVVATDGAHSKVRELANLKTRQWSYGHTAIVCTVKLGRSHDYTAWQCFTEHGPLAYLPLQTSSEDSRYCAIVWSVETAYAEKLLGMADEEFSFTLADAFENALGEIEEVTTRHSFPLSQRHCVDYFKPGLVVAGDAAHTIHPLAGQGVNLGFQDVIVLAEEIKRAQERGLSLCDTSYLQRYQRRRKGANLAMMGVMEGFKQLFSQHSLPLTWIRNQGMRQINKQAFIKRKIIKEAMGL